jgi:hypothetical protein
MLPEPAPFGESVLLLAYEHLIDRTTTLSGLGGTLLLLCRDLSLRPHPQHSAPWLRWVASECVAVTTSNASASPRGLREAGRQEEVPNDNTPTEAGACRCVSGYVPRIRTAFR